MYAYVDFQKRFGEAVQAHRTVLKVSRSLWRLLVRSARKLCPPPPGTSFASLYPLR